MRRLASLLFVGSMLGCAGDRGVGVELSERAVMAPNEAPSASTPPEPTDVADRDSLPNNREAGSWLDGPFWTFNGVVGGLDLGTGRTGWIAAHPFGDEVVCAASSESGSRMIVVGTNGSVSLHERSGQLLSARPAPADGRGYGSACENVFSDDERFALVAVPDHHVALLSRTAAFEVPVPPRKVAAARWIPNTSRFWVVAPKRWTLFETSTDDAPPVVLVSIELADWGKAWFSPDYKWMTYEPAAGGQALFDVEKGETVLSVEADDATIIDDLWIVIWHEPSGSRSKAYRLEDRTVAWARGSVVPHEPGSHPFYLVRGRSGPRVADARTGRTLASWKGAREGCAANGQWFDGSLGFIDGGTVGFWSRRRGRSEFRRQFRGAHRPVSFAGGQKFVGLASVWDVRGQKPLFALEIPEPSIDFDVVGLSLDERFLFGTRESGLVVWSLQDGSIVRDLRLEGYRWATVQTTPRGFIVRDDKWKGTWRPRAAHHDAESGTTTWFVPLVETTSSGELVDHWMIAFTDDCYWGTLPWGGEVPVDGIPGERCAGPPPWSKGEQ